MPDKISIKDVITYAWEENVIVVKQYICEPEKSKSHVCEKCREYSNRVYSWPQDANIMPELPVHPHCCCHYNELTAKKVRDLALAEKQRILKIASDEYKIQSEKHYSIFEAC